VDWLLKLVNVVDGINILFVFFLADLSAVYLPVYLQVAKGMEA
jgi:hypothetical protein